MVSSFREILGIWESPSDLAAIIGAKSDAVRKWGERDRIPSEYWQRIIGAAAARGKIVRAEDLARLAAKPEQVEAAE